MKMVVVAPDGVRPPPMIRRDVEEIVNDVVSEEVVTSAPPHEVGKMVSEGDVVVVMGVAIDFVDVEGFKALSSEGVRVFFAVVKAVNHAQCGVVPEIRRFMWRGKCLEYVGLAEDWILTLIPNFIVHH